MTRYKRICQPGLIYHVINRSNNGKQIFNDDQDYYQYLDIIYRFKIKYKFKLFSYCLMNNHIHLLIQTSGDKENISKIMQAITVSHTRHYHLKNKTYGHIWQGRFKSPIVSNDNYFLKVMNYIERNPVKAKIVMNVENYKWSSHKLNIRLEDSKLIDRNDNFLFQSLGNDDKQRIDKYKKLISKDLDENSINEIKKSFLGNNNFVSEEFKCKLNNIEKTFPKRKVGRPRKIINLQVIDNN